MADPTDFTAACDAAIAELEREQRVHAGLAVATPRQVAVIKAELARLRARVAELEAATA